MNETSATALPLLNESAPDFDAKTTHGTRKLADYEPLYRVRLDRDRKASRDMNRLLDKTGPDQSCLFFSGDIFFDLT